MENDLVDVLNYIPAEEFASGAGAAAASVADDQADKIVVTMTTTMRPYYRPI
jgi:hypothetical protein